MIFAYCQKISSLTVLTAEGGILFRVAFAELSFPSSRVRF
jgi:hypothetical protein